VRTLSSNVSGGITGGGSKPVLLVQVTLASAAATFRWAQRGTTTFGTTTGTPHWSGTAFVGGWILDKGIGQAQQQIDLPGGKHMSSLGGMTLRVNNLFLTGGLRFDEYLVDEGYELEGAAVEMRLIFDAPNASWANAVTMFSGVVNSVKWDVAEFEIEVREEGVTAWPDVPKTPVDPQHFANVDAGSHGRLQDLGKPVPIAYGQPLKVPAYLVDSTTGSQRYAVDTVKWKAVEPTTVVAEVSDELGNIPVYRWAIYADNLSAFTDAVSLYFDGVTRAAESFNLLPLEWQIGMSAESYTTSTLGGDFDSIADADYVWDNDIRTKGIFTEAGYSAVYRHFNCGVDLDEMTLYDPVNVSLYTELFYGLRARFFVEEFTALKKLTRFQFFFWDETYTNEYSAAYYDHADNRVSVDETGYPSGHVDNDGYVTWQQGVGPLSWQNGGFDYEQTRQVGASYDGVHSIYEVWVDALLAKQMNTIPVYLVSPETRAYGTSSGFTGSGRYGSATTTTLVSRPAAIVEGFLRHEIGLTTEIDTGSFDGADTDGQAWAYETATNYGGCVDSWSGGGVLTEKQNLKNVLDEVCSNFGLALTTGYDGKRRCGLIAPASSADATLVTGDVAKRGIKKRARTSLSDVKNRFVINYAWDAQLGVFTKALLINKDTGLASGTPFRYLELECARSYAAYGVENEHTANAKWIVEDDDAYKLADWLVWRYAAPAETLEMETAGLADLALELLDTVIVQHEETEPTTGLKYLLHGVVFNPKEYRLSLKLMRIRDLDRNNGMPT